MASRRPPRGFGSWSAYNEWRVRRGIERGLTPSQARGHPRSEEVRASETTREVMVIGPNGPVATTVTGVRELSRAGGADDAIGKLLAGKLSPADYNRRWAGREIGGVTVPDAAHIVALGRAGLATFTDFYPSRGST